MILLNRTTKFHVLATVLFCTLVFFSINAWAVSFQGLAPSDEELAVDPSLLFDVFDKAFAQVEDYTCTLTKWEKLKGKEYPEETVLVKFTKPYKLRLDWVDENKNGMWAIYDGSADAGHFWAKDIGWRSIIGVQRFKNDSKFTQFFHPNRFTIKDIAFNGMLDQLKSYFMLAKKLDTLQMEFRGREKEPLTGVETIHIYATLSPDPADGFLCRYADMYLDASTYMPVRVTLLGWEGEPIGKYVTSEIKINMGVSPDEFVVEK